MNYLYEREKKVPITGSYDIIVCGGGPAGVSAAVAAARRGVKTLLIEEAGCLGGVWTSGLLSLVQDGGFKNGFLKEIKDRLVMEGGYLRRSSGKSAAYDGTQDFTYDVESMKYILEDLCIQSDVTIRLYTKIVDTITDNGSIKAVITESNSGREAFTANLFIDCTGNGDLAAYAGNSYEVGHPVSGKTQPATLLAFISGFPPNYESTLSQEKKERFFKVFQEAGCEPSYKKASLFRLPNQSISCIMINHEYSVSCNSAEEITKATIHARREINHAITMIRNMEEWKDVRLVTTASYLGIREGRRIHGLYKVNVEDMIKGRRFDDGICLVEYPVDIHGLDETEESTHRDGVVSKPYHIPYRSLVAKDIVNLGLAGRCISGDFYTHASYRVTGNAVPMGEAVGIAASIANNNNINFHQVDGRLVNEELRKTGLIL